MEECFKGICSSKLAFVQCGFYEREYNYSISSKNVAIESRDMNTPKKIRNTSLMISPATPMIKAPAQRTAPIRVVSIACHMYRIAFISFLFLIFYLCGFESFGCLFHCLFPSPVYPTFFMRLPVTSVCFCFRDFIKVGFRGYKVFWKNTTRQRKRGDFFKNRRLDLVFTLRTRKYLCTRTET